MSINNSTGGELLRSSLPEKYLVKKRDFDALQTKKMRQEPECKISWRNYFNFREDRQFEANKIGSLIVERVTSPVIGVGFDGKCKVNLDSDVICLHLSPGAGGIASVRKDLALAAERVDEISSETEVSTVLGVTYMELGCVALRLGFRGMQISEIRTGYYQELKAAHRAFCAVNDRERQFTPAAVYLPTDEFVEKFSAIE